MRGRLQQVFEVTQPTLRLTGEEAEAWSEEAGDLQGSSRQPQGPAISSLLAESIPQHCQPAGLVRLPCSSPSEGDRCRQESSYLKLSLLTQSTWSGRA